MANIELSVAESALISNKEILLLKVSAMQKLRDFFGLLSEDYRKILNKYEAQVPPVLHKISPKVARGENHDHLPFVMLDYPRFFTKENIFSVRSFFWWGNFFSITLHLKGTYKINYLEKILHTPFQKGWYVCIGNAEWDHSFHKNNYQLLSRVIKHAEKLEQLKQKPFLKLAKKTTLHHWPQAPVFYRENFRQVMQILFD